VKSTRGQLLIAGPSLVDPNFWRTVVLIVEHTTEGAFGLVLNRPSETEATEAAPILSELLDDGDRVFIGGPVQPSSLIVLAQFEDAGDAALLAFDDVGVLGQADSPEEASVGVRRARAFAGHAGWGPGQLDGEIERGDWITEPARLEDAFSADAPDMWTRVLTRKGGSYALVARMPPDPSVN
jgi:putative transcriptional regulator